MSHAGVREGGKEGWEEEGRYGGDMGRWGGGREERGGRGIRMNHGAFA